MTIRPGPMTANSVSSRAFQLVRAPVSWRLMVPNAPWMSPRWASSRTAEGLGVISLESAIVGSPPFLECCDMRTGGDPISSDQSRLPGARRYAEQEDTRMQSCIRTGRFTSRFHNHLRHPISEFFGVHGRLLAR